MMSQKKIFVTLCLLGAVIYIIITLFSSKLLSSSLNHPHLMNNTEILYDNNLFEDCKNIDDLERILFKNYDRIKEHSNLYNNLTKKFDRLSKICQNNPNSTHLTPSTFKTHQQQTLDTIKSRFLNFSSPDSSSLNRDLNCARFPLDSDLNITDIYWQVTNTTNGTFYLYNAYYDDRKGVNGLPFVRILALINVLDPIVKTFCQFWYENVTEPLVVEVYEYRYIWNRKWGFNKKGASPYLISCEVPLSYPPSHVSLVQRRCGSANNVMKVKNKRPKKNKKEAFIVSVKRFEFTDDISLQIIEWCEILKILGVNKVEIFVLKVHPNVLDVLKFYESNGFIAIKFIKFPNDLPNDSKQSWHQFLQNELISFHDTFYENMYSYDYMVPMDTDEFIMPLRFADMTWMDLLNRTVIKSLKYQKDFDCYPVENRFFLLQTSHRDEKIPEIPKNLYFLQNIYRAANFTPRGGNAKTFLRTDRILTIHSHFPLSCLNNSVCSRFYVSRDDGQLSHYRNECLKAECLESMDNPDTDLSLWKFKDQILKNVKKTVDNVEKFSGGKVKIKLKKD